MKSVKFALLYGFLVWLVPFGVSFLIFPLRTGNRPFFESIMPVVVTLAAVVFAVLYLRKVERQFLREGILLGLFFLGMSLAFDLLLFSWGPMAMAFTDYIADIGFTYLLIPLITTGFGYLAGVRRDI